MSKRIGSCPDRRSFTSVLRLGLWLAAIGLWFPVQSSYAYFEDLGLGVRPIGMGEAFVAVADDSNAVAWNPAGIAGLEMRELNASYSSLYTNLHARLYNGQEDSIGFGNVGVAIPFDPSIGSVAFFWAQLSSHFYRESIFTLTYARDIGTPIYSLLEVKEPPYGVSIKGGLNLKILDWRVTPNEFTAANPALQDGNLSRTGFTADLGFLAESPEKIKFGVALENLIPANVGVTVYETVPFNLRLGTSYQYDWDGRMGAWDSILGALEFTHRQDISDIRFGTEGWFWKQMIGLRLGTTVDNFSTGASFATPLNYSDLAIRLDYAFTYPYSVKDTWGSHRLAFILKWGKLAPKPEVVPTPVPIPPEDNLADQREKELAAERAADEARLKAAMDELQGQIARLREDLKRINDLVNMGQLPTIQFETNKANLLPASHVSLDQYGEILQKYPGLKVRLEGHTDSTGTPKRNQELSQQRVESVKAYLLDKYNLTAGNLISVGYGDTRPVATNKTADGRAKNRRVELKPLVPAGMQAGEAGGTSALSAPSDSGEALAASDVVSYEDIERLREKLKVYEMQMNTPEVEEMFQQLHKDSE